MDVIPEVSDDGDNYTSIDSTNFKISFTTSPNAQRDQHTSVVSGRFVRLRYEVYKPSDAGGSSTSALIAAGLSVSEA